MIKKEAFIIPKIKINKNLYNAVEYKNENPEISTSQVAEMFSADRHSIVKHLQDYKEYCYEYNDEFYYISEEEL